MASIEAKLQQALACHQRGQLLQAQSLYEEILAQEPRHFDALHMLGVVASQSGDPVKALGLFDRALDLDAESALAHFNRGTVLQALRRWQESLASYARAIAIQRDFAEAHCNLAVVYQALRQWEAALGSCNAALAIRKDFSEALFNRGNVHNELAQWDAALASYDGAIAIRPSYPEAWFNRGNVLSKLKRWEAAIASYNQALKQKANYPAAYARRGDAHKALKQWAAALDSYDRLLGLQPSNPIAHFNRGLVLVELKQWGEAVRSLERAIAHRSDFAEAHCNLGLALKHLGQLEAALASCERALALRQDFAEAYSGRATVLEALGRREEALASYGRALAIKPDLVVAHSNRGNLLRQLGELEAAAASVEQAILLQPDFAPAHANRGAVLHGLARYEDAVASFDRAISLQPDYAEAYSDRGISLVKLGRPLEALASYERAIELKPDHAEAHCNRGLVLHSLNRLEAALAAYERALTLKPDYAEAYSNRGNVETDLGRPEVALASYERAIALKPDLPEAHLNRGDLQRRLAQYGAAKASFERACALKPHLEFLPGLHRHTRMRICDWVDLEADVAQLTAGIERGESVAPPLVVQTLVDSAALQLRAARIWAREKCPARSALLPITKYGRHDRIRVGYVSADFRNHAVAFLAAELFERHARDRFEITALSLGPNTRDEMRKRLEGAFERFIDVRERSDEEIARLARDLKLDIAVDLGGYTEGCRPGIFALRAAPLQLSYLGYLGSLGSASMDYLIADEVLVPARHRRHYDEKILYLPSYQANDSKRRIAERSFSREELGLPPSGFVFCCFNNTYKITPATFAGWMRILKAVPRSVLLLYAENATVVGNLRSEAKRREVAPERLVFGAKLPPAEYLARYRAADLFLDTLPYNAGTTASDALWAGLPVLTCTGEAFAGRMAASILAALGMPELIASTPLDYERRAVELATDPERLAGLRQRLGVQRLTAPLFDIELFTRRLEAGYKHIYERYQAGLPPEDVVVDSAALPAAARRRGSG